MSGGKGGGSSSGLGAITGSFFEGFSTMKNIENSKNYLGDLEYSYNEDANYQRRVGDRKLSLLQRDQHQYYDNMQSQIAQSGISFSGSSLDILADTGVEQSRERSAVKLDTDIRVNESYKKAAQARTQRHDIEDNAPMDIVSSFFGGGARGYSQWGGGQ